MAQLVARLVRNEKVRGSNPLSSTMRSPNGEKPSGFFISKDDEIVLNPVRDY